MPHSRLQRAATVWPEKIQPPITEQNFKVDFSRIVGELVCPPALYLASLITHSVVSDCPCHRLRFGDPTDWLKTCTPILITLCEKHPLLYFPFKRHPFSVLDDSFKIIISFLALRVNREDTFTKFGLAWSLAVLGISRFLYSLTRRFPSSSIPGRFHGLKK